MIVTRTLWTGVEVPLASAISTRIALVAVAASNLEVAREFVLTCHAPTRALDATAAEKLIDKHLVEAVASDGLVEIHNVTRAVVQAATMVIDGKWDGDILPFDQLF